MNSLEHNDESPWDKPRRDEFSTDEQNWEKMDGLLLTQLPSAPSPVLFSILIWLLGLIGIGLVCWQLAAFRISDPTGGINERTLPALVTDSISVEITAREATARLAKQVLDKLNHRQSIKSGKKLEPLQ